MGQNVGRSDRRKIFISSTSLDLQKYRAIALRVAHSLHLDRIVMEDFEAGGRNPPLEECLRRVREEADVLVVIIARRYGWVPSDDWKDLPAERVGKSITWLECLEAKAKGIDLIPLVLDDTVEWPEFAEEKHPEELEQFRRWIDQYYIAARFRCPESFYDQLTSALDLWKHGPGFSEDPARYFEWIFSKAARTLNTPGQQASLHRDYVALKAHQPGKNKNLEMFLEVEHLLVTAGPGAGKSTFLAKYACDLARQFGNTEISRLPVLLPASEFWNHVIGNLARVERGSPISPDSPQWILHFLANESEQRGWALSGSFFDHLLRRGRCAILIDGFDQADRRQMGSWLDHLKHQYSSCQIVVTSRPWAVLETRALEPFTRINISTLDNAAIKKFLLTWSAAAIPHPDQAQRHAKALHRALIQGPALRRFARTPLLLSIIFGERKPGDLPSSRADTYERITKRLLAPALDHAHQPPAYEAIEVLQKLAWAMHSNPERKTEVDSRWAGEQVTPVMQGSTILAAAKNLERLAEKTGILSADGGRLRFWHPTLQEFLAARYLCYSSGPERLRILSADLGERLVAEPWQQVLLFLGQLLEAEEDDLEALLQHLLDSYKNASAPELRTRYAAAILGLKGELSRFPDRLNASYSEMVEAVQSAFLSGDLKGVDLSTRIEIARLLGSGASGPQMVWVDIPGGVFWMGAQKEDRGEPRHDPDAIPCEGPVRRLLLPPYQIGKYPVTVEQYAAFVQDDGYREPKFWQAGGPGKWTEPLKWEEQLEIRNNPVTGMSWYEAAAFCRWAKCRLLKEAEWERAAAGPNGRRFPWGDMLPNGSCANYDGIFGGVTPVGLFPEYTSAEQVNDLAGNVWEWVLDEYDSGGERGSRKALRGGCHQNDWSFLRTSERIGARPHERYTTFGQTGFRCAREKPITPI